MMHSYDNEEPRGTRCQCVLILVLMDDALVLSTLGLTDDQRKVLILFLMDDALVHKDRCG